MILKPKFVTQLPIDAEIITPDSISGKIVKNVENLELLVGNRKKKLGDIFEVNKGTEGDDEIIIEGDVSKVKHIGARMSFGKISISGDVGMHLGREMNGGEICIRGNVDDWAGAEMKKGIIKIYGNAGGFLGSAYRGSKYGMKGGTIIVHGNAGHETGRLMRRGIIAVVNSLGNFSGVHMNGGAIFCFGDGGKRIGAGMDKGTIVMFNKPEIIPTFKLTSTYNPTFLRVFLKMLKEYGMPVDNKHFTGIYDRYSGDLASLGNGEIYIWRTD